MLAACMGSTLSGTLCIKVEVELCEYFFLEFDFMAIDNETIRLSM
jgi:hypothetical protein